MHRSVTRSDLGKLSNLLFLRVLIRNFGSIWRYLTRLKETEAELSQYNKMYAKLVHENYALKDLIEKKL